MGGHIRVVLVEIEQRMNEVGLVVLEHIGGNMPFLHDELMGNVEAVENHVKHFDVIARRLTLTVEKLEGTEIPVADDDQRMLIGILREVVGSRQRQRQTKQKG